MSGTDLSRYADMAMYRAVPTAEEGELVHPKVYMLSGTPDPLGAVAAASLMYQGKPVRSIDEVTDEQRRWFFEDIKKTRLDSPFEFIDMHFMLEGVTRAFTHQMVRQRTAVYVQESQRFAVKDNGSAEVALPPSLQGTIALDDWTDWKRNRLEELGVQPSMESREQGDLYNQMYWQLDLEASVEQKARLEWDKALEEQMGAYNRMIDVGMPAEDARGLLPTNVTTRIHYKTNLRALIGHAGNRLCTQAQFEWRVVWLSFQNSISSELRKYQTGHGPARLDDNWQWKLIADLFQPICYQTGKCEFMSDMDRHCSIRNRVNANHEIGRPSSEWNLAYDSGAEGDFISGFNPQTSVVRPEEGKTPIFIGPIKRHEWAADPSAARRKK